MKYISAIGLLIVGFLIGAALPDVDHAVPVLTHRSIVTHGFLLPADHRPPTPSPTPPPTPHQTAHQTRTQSGHSPHTTRTTLQACAASHGGR